MIRREKNRAWRVLRLMMTFACLAVAAFAQQVTEDQVKAAYLLNFAKFVEWPAGTIPSPGATLHFCTLGRSAVADELDATIPGKVIDGHAIDLRRLDGPEQARNCHLVYLAASAGKQQEKLLQITRGSPILLVGETGAFATAGGTIGFVADKGRVLFEINVKSADQAHLKISSRLLALAKIVSSPEDKP